MGKIQHSHAMRRSPEYTAWQNMKARCRPTSEVAERYADRGITICSRWINGTRTLSGFECFLADMGLKPSPKHSLDRKKNWLGYTPRNCQWATDEQQNRNRRINRIVTIAGQRLTFVEAVEKYGAVSWATARMRVYMGWDVVSAITLPKNSGFKVARRRKK